MIRNYETRRIFEELYREEKTRSPAENSTFISSMPASPVNLILPPRSKDQFRYFMASPVESTITSLPYHEALPGFVKAINEAAAKAISHLSQTEFDQILEENLAKPLVEAYIRDHSRGGTRSRMKGRWIRWLPLF